MAPHGNEDKKSMIGISKLYCSQIEPSDLLRYGRKSADLPAHLLQFSEDKKPVVVWNITRRCNLNCLHCYATANSEDWKLRSENEINAQSALALIDNLADFGVPVLLFSGGEPLLRPDLPKLAAYAVQKGLRAVVSTNGTLITKEKAAELKAVNLSYVGISLDGLEATHNAFRQSPSAFDDALQGIENCQEAGLKVGLRVTLTSQNVHEVPKLLDLVRERDIPRICFYHFVSSGRGQQIQSSTLSHSQTRQVLDLIMRETRAFFEAGLKKEVLTVDNHADGPYLWLKLLQEDPARAKDVYTLLTHNGGNSSGQGLACISWDGSVHPDQFWRQHSLGNIAERPFSEIWTDPENKFLADLRQKKIHVKGRCAACRFLDVCGGNFRARAEAASGDIWAPDPGCYLTDNEIAGKAPYSD